MYKVKPTIEAIIDVRNLAAYMSVSLKNIQAASNFLNLYNKQIQNLSLFPYAYRNIDFEYDGYQIRHKIFLSYNIFYVVDEENHQITILRVLKNRQDWTMILQNQNKYSF